MRGIKREGGEVLLRTTLPHHHFSPAQHQRNTSAIRIKVIDRAVIAIGSGKRFQDAALGSEGIDPPALPAMHVLATRLPDPDFKSKARNARTGSD